MLTKIRNAIKGKKTYILAVVGLLGAVVAWGDGQIDLLALLAAVWAACQTVFIRVGIEKSGDVAYDAGYDDGAHNG